jgi:Fic family protein
MGTSDETNDRTYRRTHPWMTFSLDLSKAYYRLWMDLGAIQSKIEHVAKALVAPNVAQRLLLLYLAKGVHATTAIEGNTLSEEQVRDRIVKKTSLPESQAYLNTEVDNIVNACNMIGQEVLGGQDARLTVERIKEFNRQVLAGLSLDEQCVPGEFRRYSVGVARYQGAPWEDCEFLVDRLCRWLNEELEPPDGEVAMGFAVIRAIMAHLYIAWIHPFGDGNGRTARLVEFQILLSGRAPSVAAHLLSNYYNQTRAEYYRQLDLASKRPDGPICFLRYALQGFRDALDEQIERIRHHQWDVAWRDYVYQSFRGEKGAAVERRRLVALELAKARPRRMSPLRLRRLTPEIAELYAKKTTKTLTRDLHELQSMKLIRRFDSLIEANVSLLTKLLPARRAGDVPDSRREKHGHRND